MRRNSRWPLLVFLLAAMALNVFAQKSKTQKPVKKVTTTKPVKKENSAPAKSVPAPDAGQDEKNVRDIVAFFEYVLNTLGSEGTSSRDKDVLVTESYMKIFRDANVQVEDDLDEARETPTNKAVVAYLKDVDFFFTDVHFEFTIDKIEKGENASKNLYYKVSLKRNLKGTTSDGKPVNNTIQRFIEINFDKVSQDLKIASIYTHEIDERDALIAWWKQLSLEWQTIFRGKIASGKENASVSDSVSITDLQDIIGIQSLDLSNNHFLQNAEPLGRLTSLQSLNLSKTNITDLTPIRNLTGLEQLDLSYTTVQELSSLKYSDKLTSLNLSHTPVSDISVLSKMPRLQTLRIDHTKVTDFSPVTGLTALVHLDISGTTPKSISFLEGLAQMSDLAMSATAVNDLSPLKDLKSISILNIDSTQVSNLSALSGLENLRILYVNYSSVSDLTPLSGLAHLEKIYCDRSGVKRPAADAFMSAHPRVLVVYDTEDIKSWWESLTGDWQEILSGTAKVGASPSKEELTRIPRLDSINLADTHIGDLEPLKKLHNLRVLIASRTSITDLTPLKELHALQVIDISETDVADISTFDQLPNLKIVRADKSQIQNIHSLYGAKQLKRLYVDQTAIHDITALEFLEKNPGCLLVYKTIHLNRWWKKLSPGWRDVFRTQMNSDTTASRENLHLLVERETIRFQDAQVSDLTAFSEFVRLKELHFSGTAIADLTPIAGFAHITSLHASSSPIQQIESLRSMISITDLDISNTPVDELKALENLRNLKQLNCAGTQIKKLDPLHNIGPLETLDCSNTKVSNLDPVSGKDLKTLKCYNTKVSTREIENFKKNNPGCTVVYYR